MKYAITMAVFFLAMSPAYGTVIKAAPDHFDFGTIDEGINAVTKIVIENTGDTLIEITNVQTS